MLIALRRMCGAGAFLCPLLFLFFVFFGHDLLPLLKELPMDLQTLPAEARALYEDIRARCRTRFEPFTVGPQRLNILRMTDLEEILDGGNPLADVSAFPFWVKIWEASLVLADLLVRLPEARDKTLLELGAGLAVPGLAAAKAGMRVSLSDYQDRILDFQRVSAAASGVSADFLLLDWKNPPEELPRFDILAGAEILFREEFFEPLLRIMERALKPEGVVYLAHDERRMSLHPFLKLAEPDYHIAVSKKRLKCLEKDAFVLLARLTPRG